MLFQPKIPKILFFVWGLGCPFFLKQKSFVAETSCVWDERVPFFTPFFKVILSDPPGEVKRFGLKHVGG